MEMLTEYLSKGFMTMLAISMPCVLTAAAIGLVVGILQAVTQVQEQTIAAAPKIFAVFLVIIIGGMGFIKLLTNLFLDYAQIMAEEEKIMTMKDWINEVDNLLKFRKKEILKDAGAISHEQAIKKANDEYEKYRVKQDKLYISSMDEMYKRYLEENNK